MPRTPPRDPCNVCCSPGEQARSVDTYRDAALLLWCGIAKRFAFWDEDFMWPWGENSTGMETGGECVDPCRPCVKPESWSRTEDSFRAALLSTLCSIVHHVAESAGVNGQGAGPGSGDWWDQINDVLHH